MARKRHGMYLSPTDDSQLVQELERCTVRGRKSDLLRNYALLGYQRALSMCSMPELIGDQAALNRALAELFAPEGAPPDFRSAAEFIKAQGLGQGRAQPTAPSPAPEPVAVVKAPSEVVPPTDEAAPAPTPEPVAERPRAKPQWGGLQSLVGGSSKDQGGN